MTSVITFLRRSANKINIYGECVKWRLWPKVSQQMIRSSPLLSGLIVLRKKGDYGGGRVNRLEIWFVNLTAISTPFCVEWTFACMASTIWSSLSSAYYRGFTEGTGLGVSTRYTPQSEILRFIRKTARLTTKFTTDRLIFFCCFCCLFFKLTHRVQCAYRQQVTEHNIANTNPFVFSLYR